MDHADAVLPRVDAPRHPREADIGDTVDGLQTGRVVVLDLDASFFQLGDFRPDILHSERSLSLVIFGANSALRDRELAVATALKDQRPGALIENLQADLIGIEVLRGVEIRRK